jgi:hypothetical protein
MSPLHLELMLRRRETFPSVSMLWKVQVSLGSVLRVAFIILPEYLFFFHFSMCSVLHTVVLFISHYVLCAYCDVHIFLSFFLETALRVLWGSSFLLLKSDHWSCGCHRLTLFLLSFSFDPQLSILYRALSITEPSVPSHVCPIWKIMLHHLSGSTPQRY